jgi:hypothetical protein
LQPRVAGAVVLERHPVAVSGPSVGLGDEAVVRPEEVGHVAADGVVGEGARNAGGAERSEQPVLELRAGGFGAGGGLAAVDQAEVERLRGGAVGVGAAQIAQRPPGRGDGEALVRGGVKACRLVHDEANTTTGNPLRDGDLDEPGHRGQQLPVRGGRPVAQHGAVSGGEQAGDHPAAVAQRLVPDGIHAPKHGDQTLHTQPVLDPTAREPQREWLPRARPPASPAALFDALDDAVGADDAAALRRLDSACRAIADCDRGLLDAVTSSLRAGVQLFERGANRSIRAARGKLLAILDRVPAALRAYDGRVNHTFAGLDALPRAA